MNKLFTRFGKDESGATAIEYALIAAIVFLAGVRLLFLGLIGEYLGRTFEQVKGRPLYLVESVSRSAGQEVGGSAHGAPRVDPPRPRR